MSFIVETYDFHTAITMVAKSMMSAFSDEIDITKTKQISNDVTIVSVDIPGAGHYKFWCESVIYNLVIYLKITEFLKE